MKNIKAGFMLAGLMLCAAAAPAYCQVKAKEEKQLEAGAADLNKNYSEGRERVAGKIKAEFKVEDELLVGLRFKELGNGEIAVILAMAQNLPGGITDANLHKIVALRDGPPPAGWGKIAKELGLKLGPAISRVRKISAEVRKQEKIDTAEKKRKAAAEKAEAAKKARAEKAEAAKRAAAEKAEAVKKAATEKAEAAKKARAEKLEKSKAGGQPGKTEKAGMKSLSRP